jgi:osmoprotectant transport system permease protein
VTDFWNNYGTDFLQRLLEHVAMVLGSVFVAALIAFPLGFVVWDRPATRGFLLGICNVMQTVPGLALLAFLMPMLGIGWPPTVAALVLYTMLPMLKGTLTSFGAVAKELREVGMVFGLTRAQMVWHIMIPQSAPFLVAGLRTSLVWAVSLATLGAFIGAGGLGDFINRGIALNDTRLVLLGAVPAALLAVSLDAALGRVELWAHRWRSGE